MADAPKLDVDELVDEDLDEAERCADFATRLDRLVTSFHPCDADEALMVIGSLLGYATLLGRSMGMTDEKIRAIFEDARALCPPDPAKLRHAKKTSDN